MRITSFTPMKDEGPFILEWVAYHRLIGFNDIHVFSNDCADGTDLILERLDEMGLLRHLTNPSVYQQSNNHHWEAVRYMNSQARLKRSDWVVSLDVDEFICVKAGTGTLVDLFEATNGANVIAVNQQNFGCGGVHRYQRELQMKQFLFGWKQSGAYNVKLAKRGVKTLTHASAEARYFGNHSPLLSPKKAATARFVNGSGTPLPGERLKREVKSLVEPDFGFDLVQLNHYVLRSMEDFILKSARGNANHATRQADLKYWRRYDHNDLRDEHILRWSDRVAAQMAEWLEDKELRLLHEASIRHNRARFKALLQDDVYRDLRKAVRGHHHKNPGLAAAELAGAAE